MSAFLTGSHAYGTPTPSSDVDLCVCMDAENEAMLSKLADSHKGSRGDSPMFGKLNILIFQDRQHFNAWHKATQRLIAERPVTRNRAIEVIDEEVKQLTAPAPTVPGRLPDVEPEQRYQAGNAERRFS